MAKLESWEKGYLCGVGVIVLLIVGFWVTVGYVALHFIQKFW